MSTTRSVAIPAVLQFVLEDESLTFSSVQRVSIQRQCAGPGKTARSHVEKRIAVCEMGFGDSEGNLRGECGLGRYVEVNDMRDGKVGVRGLVGCGKSG